MKRTLSLAAIAALMSIALIPASFAQDTPIVEGEPSASLLKTFDLSTETFQSADQSQWSGGFSWDLGFGDSLGDIALGYGLQWDLSSSGALSWDEELNRTPILGEFKFFGAKPFGRAKMLDEWDENGASPNGGFQSTDESTSFHELIADLGITARYETDQLYDNSNGVAALNFSLVNPNRFNTYSLIPTVNVHVDAVLPDQMQGVSSDANTHGRFRADAFWSIPMDLLGGGSILESSQFNVFTEYTKSFGDTDALKAAGLDESWGAWAEYVYVIKDGVNESGPNSAPLSLFVRGGFGRMAPISEEDEIIMIGVRLGLKELWSR